MAGVGVVTMLVSVLLVAATRGLTKGRAIA